MSVQSEHNVKSNVRTSRRLQYLQDIVHKRSEDSHSIVIRSPHITNDSLTVRPSLDDVETLPKFPPVDRDLVENVISATAST